MKKIFLPILALAIMATGCKPKQAQLSAGIDLNNMDQTAVPGNDFYQYACGGWMANNPLTAEYSRFGSFDKLGENNRIQLNDLIKEMATTPHEKGTVGQKIGDMYNLAMDSVRLNQEGVSPIVPDLERIAAITSVAEIPALMADMNADMFFGVYVDADIQDSKKNLLQTYQSGIGMGERDYYIESDEKMTSIREQYVTHIAKMFQLAGYSEADAAKAAADVMRIETRLATSQYDNVALRDPMGNYHKMSLDQLKADYPNFDWDMYFNTLGAQVTELSVSQPEPIKEAIAIINAEELPSLKNYMSWRLIDGAASFLNDEVGQQNFDFYGKVLSGRQEQSPRWKRAVSVTDGSLGEAVGQVYVEKYFSPEAKARMEKLVANLLQSYSERMANLTWMSDSTKAMAQDKLASIYVKVGYPNKWRDYSNLDIDPTLNYWENVKRVQKFNTDYMLSKMSKPVDRDEWYMTPQTVNAYYNPTTNEICFPAGILQYPFFDMSADDAFNFGAIGVVIAHEITHGFDDQGCQFDKNGNLKNWWTEQDKANFEARANVMKEYFDGIEVAPGLHANGAFTLGENIADHGGLQVAYHALTNSLKENPLPVLDGLTAQQRFFIAYANVWAGNIRPEEILRRTKSDPHSLGRWRVNGALPHIDGWYEAFNITENDSLYLAPEKRVSIW